MNEEPNVGAVHAAVEARFAGVDAERKAHLDWLVKRGGTCRGCGATVADANLEMHPGACSSCFWKKHLPGLTPPASSVTPAPQPRGEPPMPCSACGSKDHNKRTCPEEAKPAASPPAKLRNPTIPPTSAPPPKRTSASPAPLQRLSGPASLVVAKLDVEQLLQLVGEARKELVVRRDQARALAAKLETAVEELGNG